MIEKVQGKFLRYLFYKETGTYLLHIPKTDVMNRHNIMNLEHRRNVASVLFLYKLLNNQISDHNLLGLISLNVPSYRTRNPLMFYVDTYRTNYYSNSPIIVMCRLNNQIANNCDIFKANNVLFRKTVIPLLRPGM